MPTRKWIERLTRWNPRFGELLTQFIDKGSKDNLDVYASGIAFRALFAIFPTVVSLIWLLSLFHAAHLIDTLLGLVTTTLPETAADPIREQVTGAPEHQANGSFTPWAIFASAVSLWAISSIFRAAMEALNAIYGVEEGRSLWKRYPISLLVSLVVSILLLSALIGVAAGSQLVEAAFGSGTLYRVVWALVKWPVLILVVLTAFVLVYYFAPDAQQRVRWIRTGTVSAVLLWLLFTILFSWYVNNFGAYAEIYGALAGFAVLMVYVYATSFVLLLGAELNQVIEMRDPAGKDEGEKTPEAERPQPVRS